MRAFPKFDPLLFSLLDVREGDLKEGGALFRLPFSVMGVVGVAKDGVADFVLGSMRMHGDWQTSQSAHWVWKST